MGEISSCFFMPLRAQVESMVVFHAELIDCPIFCGIVVEVIEMSSNGLMETLQVGCQYDWVIAFGDYEGCTGGENQRGG